MPDPLRGDLVDRYASVNIRAGGFLDPDPREKSPAGPRMVPRPIHASVSIHLIQSAQDLDLALDLGEIELLDVGDEDPTAS